MYLIVILNKACEKHFLVTRFNLSPIRNTTEVQKKIFSSWAFCVEHIQKTWPNLCSLVNINSSPPHIKPLKSFDFTFYIGDDISNVISIRYTTDNV